MKRRITVICFILLALLFSLAVKAENPPAPDTTWLSINETLKKTNPYYFFSKTPEDPLVRSLLPFMADGSGDRDFKSYRFGLKFIFNANPKMDKNAKINEVIVSSPYPGPLSQNLRFDDSCQEAVKKLGPPVNWDLQWIGYYGSIQAGTAFASRDEPVMIQVSLLYNKVKTVAYISGASKPFNAIPQGYLDEPDNLLSLLHSSMNAIPHCTFWDAVGKPNRLNNSNEYFYFNKGIQFTLKLERGSGLLPEPIVTSIRLDPAYRANLPHGITFDDSLANLEAKLGKSWYNQKTREYEFPYLKMEVSFQNDKLQYIRFNSRECARNQLDPVALTKGTFNNLPRYLGKSVRDKELQELLKAYGSGVFANYGSYYELYYHRFNIRLKFDKNGFLTEFNFHNGSPGFDNYYRGPLPGDIHVYDNRESIDKKLGPPLNLKNDGSVTYATYRSGINITYYRDEIRELTLTK